jgi:hypothetical protein
MKIMKFFYIFIFFSFYVSGQYHTCNEEFIINTYTPSDQILDSIGKLEDGGFVVTWSSNGQSESYNYTVYAQIFNHDLTRRGGEFWVCTYEKGWQSASYVSGLRDSRFVVIWQSHEQDGSLEGIFAQIFSYEGSKEGPEFQVNTTTDWDQVRPVAVSLEDGGFIVFWETQIPVDTRLFNAVYGQRFSSDGLKLGDEFRVSGSLNTDNDFPAVSVLKDSTFVLCYNKTDEYYTYNSVFAQLFDLNGQKIGDEVEISTNALFSNIERLSDGSYIIIWFGFNYETDQMDIFGKIFNHDFTEESEEFQVNMKSVRDFGLAPQITSINSNGFIICWTSPDEDFDKMKLLMQFFNSDGNKRGGEFEVFDDAITPQIAGISDSTFIVLWSGDLIPGNRFDVFGKYYPLDQNYPLTEFKLLEPQNDATLNSVKQSFNWEKSNIKSTFYPWEVEYELYLDVNENFVTSTIIDFIYDTSYTVQNLTPGTTYFWKVLAKNIAGDSLWSTETNLFYVSEDATSIKHPVSSNPETFELYANFPNPFNPETTISYKLPQGKAQYPIKVGIYDTLGRSVITLLDENQLSGYHSLKWNGKNDSGNPLPSGVNYCLVQAGKYKAVQKMLLVR